MTLHRGHCRQCGWHGRTLTEAGAAQWAAAVHWRRTGHMAVDTQTAEGPRPAPWTWRA